MPDLNLRDLRVASETWRDGGTIPVDSTEDGDGRSPEVHWSGVPNGTVELALVLHDPDAPLVDGFTHWAVHGIDPGETGLATGQDPADIGAITDLNELGTAAYTGPAPPPGHGVHHYFLHLYALDEPVDSEAPLEPEALHERLRDHVLAQARLVATYAR